MKTGEIVLPGDEIGEVNKYKPGEGTYTENGKIKAKVIGRVKIDKRNGVLSVEPLKDPKKLHTKEIVLGEVVSVSNTIANIKIYFVYKKGEIKRLYYPFSATLHISQLGFRASKLSEYMKVGDLIAARIILDRTVPLSLSIASRELGIIAAYCGTCGGAMKIKDARTGTMVCTRCGKNEKRKLSSMYDFNLFTRFFKAHKPKHFEVYNG